MPVHEPGPDQSCPVEPRADILRRRAALYRVCLRDRIGAAPACNYFREVVAAEAELALLLRSNRQDALIGAPEVANTRRAPSQQRVSDFLKGARFEEVPLSGHRIEVQEHLSH